MIAKRLHARITIYVKKLQVFVDRAWYPPLIGILAALDNFVVVIPNDGILVSSSMLIPKRWLRFCLWVSLGSTLGAFFLALFIKYQGLPLILQIYPDLEQTRTWIWTLQFFEKYGLLLVFIVALLPVMQQPAVILASLGGTPALTITGVIFIGRLIKYLIMAYLGSHAPGLLAKVWGLKEELDEVGVKID